MQQKVFLKLTSYIPFLRKLLEDVFHRKESVIQKDYMGYWRFMIGER